MISIAKYQTFYNNILAEPFEIMGSKIGFVSVSAHRRATYRLGQIPNKYAAKYSGSPVLFLTCTVDVHKNNLAVTVLGWCKDARPYVITYERYERAESDDECNEISSPVWTWCSVPARRFMLESFAPSRTARYAARPL